MSRRDDGTHDQGVAQTQDQSAQQVAGEAPFLPLNRPAGGKAVRRVNLAEIGSGTTAALKGSWGGTKRDADRQHR